MNRMIRNDSLLKERLELSRHRILEIAMNTGKESDISSFFRKEAEQLVLRFKLLALIENGSFDSLPYRELKEWNQKLFEDVLGENYLTSYTNPTYSVAKLGEAVGKEFSHLSYLILNSSEFLFKGIFEKFVEVAELFLEIHGIMSRKEGDFAVKAALYDFKYDTLSTTLRNHIEFDFLSSPTNLYQMVMEENLKEPSLLYRFGSYVNEDDERVFQYLAKLSPEEISNMAKTLVDGFFNGFQTMGIDVSNKKSVKIFYHLGFERLVKEEVLQFKERGLSAFLIMSNEGANRQVDYDHKNDLALIFNERFASYYLEVYDKILSEYKEDLLAFAGPVAMETFGEKEFQPENKSEASKFGEEQKKSYHRFLGKRYQCFNRYSPAEKRSFSIIAYPLPGISKERYEEIFKDVIRINTMDSEVYRELQQELIDALDKGEYVHIKGSGSNETDLKVMLHELKDREKETNFENCVADVNIPVGEVFTSPKLKGTTGKLHVSKVYLNGLLYKDLRLQFIDGMISEYSVNNFALEEDNRRFVEENLLHLHPTLPMGEFAIGTNTLAYTVGIKYDIGGKLPILIAEKTGPHFAVGDTCYAMQEDHPVYNPDGKEVIARENECSARRKVDIDNAYFNCHTDITLPYNELGEIAVYSSEGDKVILIKDGRFVLPKTSVLNKALDEM